MAFAGDGKQKTGSSDSRARAGTGGASGGGGGAASVAGGSGSGGGGAGALPSPSVDLLRAPSVAGVDPWGDSVSATGGGGGADSEESLAGHSAWTKLPYRLFSLAWEDYGRYFSELRSTDKALNTAAQTLAYQYSRFCTSLAINLRLARNRLLPKVLSYVVQLLAYRDTIHP